MVALPLPIEVLEESLNLGGAVIAVIIAYISYWGYRQTRSPTLLRLALAFTLLSGSFLASGLVTLANQGLLPSLALMVGGLLLLASALEAVGYFFLAFSHMLNVKALSRSGLAPGLVLLPGAIGAALKSLSLYFLLYGVLETLLSYTKTKKKETLVITIGLGLLAGGEFIRWFSYFDPQSNFILGVALLIKVIGLTSLLVPVVSFFRGRSSLSHVGV